MKTLIRLLGLWLTSFPLATLAADEEGYVAKPISQILEEVKNKQAVLVDVREQNEWDAGHIQGAIFIPLSQIQEWQSRGISPKEKAELAQKLPSGKKIYCHCKSGGRAVFGAEGLSKMGHEARPLKHGYKALVQAGFPDSKP